MKITLKLPHSHVRYPRTTIIIMSVLMFILVVVSIYPFDTYILFIAYLWLTMTIDDREEQRKGYRKCVNDVFDSLLETGHIQEVSECGNNGEIVFKEKQRKSKKV